MNENKPQILNVEEKDPFDVEMFFSTSITNKEFLSDDKNSEIKKITIPSF